MELNDAVSSDFIDFQDSFVHTAPSSDHYMDDDPLGKLLAEVQPRLRRLPPVRKVCVSVRRLCQSWSIKRVNLWRGAIAIILVLVSET